MDKASEILSLAADISDNGMLDDQETRSAAEGAYEVLGRLLGRTA
jgi:hypothetical protein